MFVFFDALKKLTVLNHVVALLLVMCVWERVREEALEHLRSQKLTHLQKPTDLK